MFGCQEYQALNSTPTPVYTPPDTVRANQVTFEVLWQETSVGYLRKDFGGTHWEQVHDS